MRYASDYIDARYPNQEVAYCLHCEHCAADNTDRYAVHIVINRTDLETGRRLNEGRSRQAKIGRANTVRDMDSKWHLGQVREGERNSRIHAQQPTRKERAMAERGVRSDKAYIRQAVRASMKELQATGRPQSMRDLAVSLEDKGVVMRPTKNNRSVEFEREKTGFKCRGYKLGAGFSRVGLERGLKVGAERQAQQQRGREMELER